MRNYRTLIASQGIGVLRWRCITSGVSKTALFVVISFLLLPTFSGGILCIAIDRC
jgi:hypothetical protein